MHTHPIASPQLLGRVDHLVYATPDLNLGTDTLEKLLGVRATLGGQHLGLGTRNTLIALWPFTYLEIVGPDPEQPKPASPRWFGIDELKAPRLARWAANGNDLDQLVSEAAQHGVKLGAVASGSRNREDGVVLSWLSRIPLRLWPTGSCRSSLTGDRRPIRRSPQRKAPSSPTFARNIPAQNPSKKC